MYKIKIVTIAYLFFYLPASPSLAQDYDVYGLTLAKIENLTEDQCNGFFEEARAGAWRFVDGDPRSTNAVRQYLRRGLENLCLAKHYENQAILFEEKIVEVRAEIVRLDREWAEDVRADPTIQDFPGRRRSQENLESDIDQHEKTVRIHRRDVEVLNSLGAGSFELAVNSAPIEATELIERLFGALPPLS